MEARREIRGYARVRQAAEYAGVKERTFRSWLKQGLRHSRLPSGTVLVSFQAIDEYVGSFEVSESKIDEIVDGVIKELV